MRSLALALIVTAHFAARAQSIPTFVTTPLVTINDSIGDTTRTSARLVDAKRLSDGRMVAAVCGPNELRSYDAAGKRLGTISLLENPGPQRILWRLFSAGGDTLGAFENLNVRLTLIDPAFRIARTVTIPNPDTTTFNGRPRSSRLDVIGRLADGTYIGRIAAPLGRDSGYQRRPLPLYHFDGAGRLLDSLTTVGNEDRVIPGSRVPQSIRLGRTTTVAVVGDRLVVGDQTTPFLVEHDGAFKVTRRTPTITKPVAVTDSVRAAWTRIAVERSLTPTNGVIPPYGDFYPDSTAAFRDLVAGTDRRVWAQDPLGADFYPLIWTAYQDGRPVARAELPSRFYPTQFGPDWVLGLAYDTTQADRLQLLKLTPGALTNAHLSPRDAAPANRPRCGAFSSR
jgi:hypothetical protein